LLLIRILFCLLKNRILTRIRRLRQIRYLVGTLAGIAYFALLFRPWRSEWLIEAIATGESPDPEITAALLVVGAVLLTFLLVAVWIYPGRRAALQLTEAEIDLLFAAPLSRRQVIDYSLLKAQIGILLAVVLISLLAARNFASSMTRAMIGIWILLTFAHLYLTGVAVVRSNIVRHGRSALRRVWPVLLAGALLVGSLLVGILLGSLRMPAPDELPHLARYIIETGEGFPLGWLLVPAQALLRPIVAGDVRSFLLSLAPALGLLALSYVWVVRSDFQYEEASAEAAARRADRRSAKAAGRRRVSGEVTWTPFRLASRGGPVRALIWRSLVATWRLTPWPAAILVFAVGAIASLILTGAVGAPASADVSAVIGLGCFLIAAIFTLFGPEMARSDLRSDLPHAGLLKSYPVGSSSLMLAEVSGPAVFITFAQALLLAAGLPLLPGVLGWSAAEWALAAAGILVLLAPINLVMIVVQNATVLLLPAWHHLGPGRARGIAAMGQNIVSMFFRLLAFAVAALPAALIFGLGLFLLRPLTGPPAAFLLAAVPATVPAIVEIWLGVALLGFLFERFDISRELDAVT
jgi:hypothetical protein